jgi:uncharacterized protein YecE (DUF72 family)
MWAERVDSFLNQGIDIYGFFNNHFAGHSPASVRQFAELLGITFDLPGEFGQMRMDLDDG